MPLKQKRNVTNDNQIRTSFKMSLEYNSNYVIKVLSSSMKNALKLSFFPLYHTNINHTLTHSLTLLKPFKCNAMDNLRQISFINIMPRSLARRRCAIALWELVSHFFCCLFTLTLLSSYMTLILMRIKNINIFIKAEKYRRKMTMKKKSEMTF